MKPKIAQLLANIDARLRTEPNPARFLETQADFWADAETKLYRWATNPGGRAAPFNGELDAFDIASIRVELAKREGNLTKREAA